MPRKVSARCTFAVARDCGNCSTAAIISAGFVRGRKMWPAIVGLGKAAEIARESLAGDASAYRNVARRARARIASEGAGCSRERCGAPRTPNTTNITFAGIEGEALVIALDLKGLACSTGAACSSGAVEPSHVLTAIGLTADEARASLRFSLGRHTTPEQIDVALQVIPAAVAQLRELSPTYRKTAEAR